MATYTVTRIREIECQQTVEAENEYEAVTIAEEIGDWEQYEVIHEEYATELEEED